uniref:C2H2-type domain-containing protein n=1 Tax=Timema tahoe TaxID=61484 RepID=A0A7R9P0E6_9NEOP|nr:unnamed protein product [Timema tahoe]
MRGGSIQGADFLVKWGSEDRTLNITSEIHFSRKWYDPYETSSIAPSLNMDTSVWERSFNKGAAIMEPGNFPCTSCGKNYRWKRSLVTHMKLECGKEPSFQCFYCPFKSKLKGNLNKHMRVKHNFKPTLPRMPD